MNSLNQILKTNANLNINKQTVINVSLVSIWIKDEVLTALKPYELSIEQFNVLRILRGKKGEAANLKDIQDRMVNKMSNTTRLVDKLILKQYVERFICEKNRRKVEIFITDKGLDILQTIDPIIDHTEQQITKNLSPSELKQLNTLLLKMR